MNRQIINNSIDLIAGIPWQYDKAVNLKKLVLGFEEMFNSNSQNFWDSWRMSVFNLGTADDFGLSVWGALLSTPRPENISADFYRQILKGKLFLMNCVPSVLAINEYLKIAFGYVTGSDGKNINNVVVLDNLDMSIDYVVTPSADLSDEAASVIETDNTVVKWYDANKHMLIPQYAADGSVDHYFYFSYDGTGSYPRVETTATPATSVSVLSGTGKYHSILFPYPTGVGDNSCRMPSGILGLNENQEEGQNLENMALLEDQTSGGSFYAN